MIASYLVLALCALAIPLDKCYVPEPSTAPSAPYPDVSALPSPAYPDVKPTKPEATESVPPTTQTPKPTSGPVYPDVPVTTAVEGTSTASSPSPSPKPEVVNKLTLLHTNDIHSHLEEFNRGGTACRATDIGNNTCFGGAARIKTKVDEIRAKTKDVVLFDAGDQFQGTLFFTLLGGGVSAEAMNDIGYDAMAIGNHEFDNGVDVLGQFIKNLTFPALSSNIDLSSSPVLREAGLKPYIILEKYKLGIVGYITKTTPDIVSKAGLKGTKFMDPIETVQKSIDELHAKGIKRIICVSHNGYRDDQLLASRTKGINVIVGGHSHSLLLNNATLGPVGPYPTKVTDLNNGTTYIVQAHRFGNYLGNLNLEWDSQDQLVSITGEPILLDQRVPQEPKLKAKVTEWSKVFEQLAKDVLTTATEDFANSCRGQECAMGNLITDCMLEVQKSKGLQADLAMINAGGIRAAIERGPVTSEDIYTISPFGNAIVKYRWTGAQLMDTLNRVANGQSTDGKRLISPPLFGGVRYTFNNGTTKSISDVTVNGKPWDAAATYEVLSVDFIVGGGDNIMNPIEAIPGDLLAETLVTCLRGKASISPNLDGRFKVVQ
jgi:5'-nucleotidase